MDYDVALIGTLLTLVTAMVAVLSYQLTKKKEDTKEVKEGTTTQTTLKMQLEYISRGIDDIKSEMRDIKTDAKQQDIKINMLVEKIARLEESEKSAHKRINELEARINEIERK
jgi:chromosome segregation ATPase